MVAKFEGDIKVKLIDKKDNEVFRTAVFMSKMQGKHNEIKNILREKYENNPSDLDTAFAYAVFSLLPYETDDVLEQKEAIETAIDVFDHILRMQPGNWLARYYKIHLLSMFSDSFRDDEEIIEELESLIYLQESCEHKPYFVLPHLQLAELYFGNGERVKAKELLTNAESMKKEPIKILSDFLYHQVIGFESKLRISGENHEADRVNRIGCTFFPDLCG